MNRCFSARRSAMRHLVGLCAWLPVLAAAQTIPERSFPAQALRGILVVTEPPVVTLNGKQDRLSPGARIRGTDNMLRMSAALIGQKLVVNYTREQTGLIHEVWILTSAEAAEKRSTSASTTTTLPLPFDQLPVYPNR